MTWYGIGMTRPGAILLLMTSCLSSPADPFSGTWKLNSAKSRLPGQTPHSLVIQIQVHGEDIRIREETVLADGRTSTVTMAARFDGKDYPVNGSHSADHVFYRRLDSHTIVAGTKKDGNIVVRDTVSVSADGTTMTDTGTFTENENGMRWRFMAVLEKQ